jgi:hypothetical protein
MNLLGRVIRMNSRTIETTTCTRSSLILPYLLVEDRRMEPKKNGER